MHSVQDYLVGLCQLHELGSVDEQRSVWRQGMATLATAAASQQPTPLEGLRPDALLAGVRAALAAGLVDDLHFLSKPVAAAALFEIAAALPTSVEKRELGRRVLKALNEGDAATFVTLATSLALASRRALAGATVRARVALSLRLPIGTGISADGLALALISRPELEREWLSGPSTGSLPSRRLAARLIESAAREAARRAQDGDDSGVHVFGRPTVRAAWGRLIADRESLVWRHMATARGLLAATTPGMAEEIERELGPKQGISEWRRAAASVAASIVSDPVAGLARCRDILKSDLPKRDPGMAAAMIFGLTRAGEEEPEAAEELLGELMGIGGVDVMEALVDLREEHVGSDFGAKAAATALGKLRGAPAPTDDGLVALTEALVLDLGSDADRSEPTLRSRLASALLAFAEGKPLDALTGAALATAQGLMASLEKTADDTTVGRLTAFKALRELDLGLLETSTLADLVALVSKGEADKATSPLVDLLGRLNAWILTREQLPLGSGSVPHQTLRLRRMRTLLHLLDFEGTAGEDTSAWARERRMKAFRALLGRAHGDPPSSPLRRTVCAALARSCDSLVRDEICELSDILVAVSSSVRGADALQILAEASMAPEVKDMFKAAADVARALAVGDKGHVERTFLECFRALAESLPPGTSARVEGLRRALFGMARALEFLHEAATLADLRKPEGEKAVERLEEAVEYGAQLVAGVRRRLGLNANPTAPTVGRAVRALDAALDRAMREDDEDLAPTVTTLTEALRAELPLGVATVAARVLARIPKLPREASIELQGVVAIPAERRLRLPPWLPPSRSLGGFYVLRPIGSGAGGSVFVVRRTEERHDERSESYALKVPQYNGSAAHTLSEDEFLQLFREEAGALLTLPQHPNLAGFVTFDVRARPKPILVMELVQGPTVERILDKRELSMAVSLAILDGIAGGLAAMHFVGVGHLDVKPANIILRQHELGQGSRLLRFEDARPVPVLVDFGLAGRKVRPGCGSPYYSSPEVWDADILARGADPTASDVYAYCCLAYEFFTGHTLFEGDTLLALVAAHLSHDGNPPGLQRLRNDPRVASLADVLSAGLQPDPKGRTSIHELRSAFSSLRGELEHVPWPAGAG